MAKDPTPQQWAASVLQRLGFKQTPGAIQALVGWAKAEGGHYNNSAKYNLLNTTQPEPGSQTFRSVGQGAADIRIYNSWDQGIDATVKTLKNGLYGGILAGLRKGDPSAVAHAIDSSKWGTHGQYLYDAIGSTKVSGSAQPYASQPAVPHGASPATPATPAVPGTPGVDNSLLRRQLVGQFLQQGGVANPRAVMSLAGSYGQAQDVPGTAGTPGTPATPSTPTAPTTPSPSGPGGSKVLELIFNDGGKGYGIKNGQTVDGQSVYGAVWAGHAGHVHVAAGPKTVVALGKLAQSMGLNVGENPHFGGVDPVHVQGSYHYKGEAIDVSGDKAKMAAFARKVAAYNRTRRLP